MPQHEPGMKTHEKERKLNTKAKARDEKETLAPAQITFAQRKAAMRYIYNDGLEWNEAWRRALCMDDQYSYDFRAECAQRSGAVASRRICW